LSKEVTQLFTSWNQMGRWLRHVSDLAFWVLQEHGYEDETYLIAEIGPADVRYPITVNGGGC
jgi:hypothetical protein